ncbi:MAG: co-chaperone DjlA [Gammaproteobacteria bacterium]|nr:co-chaperone DjlA [Gammaproteobacteria bacterium]
MAWWGKLLGGAFGFMLGGPLGALLGASLGHQFDSGMRGVANQARPGAQERVQAAFFTATFAVMGHVAKADGRVSREEIKLAEEVMRHMQLDAAQRKLARALFNQGKQPGFALEEILAQFRRECHGRRTLIQFFMEIQAQAALADGRIAPAENAVLMQVADALGVAREELRSWMDAMRGAHAQSGRGHERGAGMSLADACRVLGIRENAPLPEARKAYRRLLGQHHPDKLVAKGLPEEMIKLANEKTHEIRSAWERVKRAKQSA